MVRDMRRVHRSWWRMTWKFFWSWGRLAFEHLEKGNITFYQEDLERCGLDVTEASVYSGSLVERSSKESVWIFQKTVYCFVHLSIQEFLAAVYMFHCYTNSNTEVLEDFLGEEYVHSTLDVFLRRAMMKSFESKNGHLDLFVRFLHGLSLESNQRLLGDLLGQTDNSPEIIQRIINNLKEMNMYKTSPDRSNQHLPLSDGDERPLSTSGDPWVPEVREQIREETLWDPLLSSGLHAADVRGGSGWVGPEKVQHNRRGTKETDSSCEELQKSSVSPDVINFIDQCRLLSLVLQIYKLYIILKI